MNKSKIVVPSFYKTGTLFLMFFITNIVSLAIEDKKLPTFLKTFAVLEK